MNDFPRFLSDKIDDYIQLRRSLGYVFHTQAATLKALCRFSEQVCHAGPLTRQLVMAFVFSRDVTPNVRARRHAVLVRFAEYLSVFDPRTEALDPRALPRSHATPPARILNDSELACLLVAARDGSPRHPFRGQTLYTVLGLLASTGLRSGEVLRLDRTDVDLTRGILEIRRTKFRKDRLVPLHPSACEALRVYAGARNRTSPGSESPAFFLGGDGRSSESSDLRRSTLDSANSELRPSDPDLRSRQ